jgi:hypothetical protein
MAAVWASKWYRGSLNHAHSKILAPTTFVHECWPNPTIESRACKVATVKVEHDHIFDLVPERRLERLVRGVLVDVIIPVFRARERDHVTVLPPQSTVSMAPTWRLHPRNN